MDASLHAMDPLEAAAIDIAGLNVRVIERCSSTNTVLLEEQNLLAPVLLAAEEQSAGRGRRGRRWHSERGAGIMFSLAYRVGRPAREIAALPLVAGVACARALRAFGVRASLKWPNDLVVGEAKLGGILVETRSAEGASLAAIGVGVNCRDADRLARQLRRRVASLDQFIAPLPSRNELIRKMAIALLDALDAFETLGLESVRRDWEQMDAHAGRRLRVRLADGRMLTGIASGLAENGGLQLRTRAGIRAVASGRVVSSRAA